MLWATSQSSEHEQKEAIYAELKQYDPKNMVVPPHLIGDAKSALKKTLSLTHLALFLRSV